MSMKWILIGLVVLYLFRNRLFPRAGVVTVTRPADPLYSTSPPRPGYASSPPTPALGRPPTNIFDVISAGIGAGAGVLSDYITDDY